MVCFYLPFIRSAWTSTSLLGKLVWVCGCEGVRLSLNVAANLGSLMSFVPSAGAWYGEPRKKQVERLAFFYPIRRIGMESPAGCMESVAKRRHGITRQRVSSFGLITFNTSCWFHTRLCLDSIPQTSCGFHPRLSAWFYELHFCTIIPKKPDVIGLYPKVQFYLPAEKTQTAKSK